MVQTVDPLSRPTNIISARDVRRARVTSPNMPGKSNRSPGTTSRIPTPMPRRNSPMPSPSVINAHRLCRSGLERPVTNVQQVHNGSHFGTRSGDVKAWIEPRNNPLLGSSGPSEVIHSGQVSQMSTFGQSGGIQANRLTNSNGTVEVHYSFAPEKPVILFNDFNTDTNDGYNPSGPSSSAPNFYLSQTYSRSRSFDTSAQILPSVHSPSPAASFFARAAQKLSLSAAKRTKRRNFGSDNDVPSFPTPICDLIRLYPPPAPPALLRNISRKDPGVGKVKVMLRIPPVPQNSDSSSSFISLDNRKKQVTVFDPSTCGFKSSTGELSKTPMERRAGVIAPKMFAFDAIFSQDDSQTEVCCSALTDIIQAVVNGADGCIFCYGQGELGKTYTMIGSTDSSQKLGIIPCAITWLFKMINEQKVKTGARFSVRMSAVDVVGKTEVLRDLLEEQAAGTENSGQSPGIYLLDDPVLGAHLQNQSELRAPNAEKATYYLDSAIAVRNRDQDGLTNSHMMVTLHVYQYRIDKSGKGAGVAGGRSRLHMFDLGSCYKQSKSDNSSLSLSALGNVIIAIFNGQKHVPYKDSKLTQLLREALSSITCRAAMIAHISTLPSQYSETLSTIQLAARIHRMRRKKMKFPMASNQGESSCEERVRNGMRSATSSDADATSSSEQSCDTVIYVGPNGAPVSDRELTDNEGPPVALPIAPKASTIGNSVVGAGIKSTDVKQSLTLQKPVGKSGTLNSALKSVPNNVDGMNVVKPNSGPANLKPSSSKYQFLEGLAQSPNLNPKNRQNSPATVQGNVTKHQKYSHHSMQHAKSKISGQKETKSDEQWIDGPRISKQKLENAGAILQKKGNERWVDGPASYGYMDDHKRNMIEKWVEIHSTHVLTNLQQDEKKSEIWIDKPNTSNVSAKPSVPKRPPVVETKKIVPDKTVNSNIGKVSVNSTTKKEIKHRLTSSRSTQSMSSSEHLSEELNENVDVNDTSTSPMQQASTDGEDVRDSEDDEDYDDDQDVIESESAGEIDCESFECFQTRGKVVLEYAPSEDDDHLVEIIEVEEPEKPVPTVDCAIQCNEEDIIACMILQSEGSISSENPLPEVDQDSEDDHPLRVLSEENLASSFTDSRSVSVDLEAKTAYGDNADCESTCSSLSRQLILSTPSTIQRGSRPKGCDEIGNALMSETFTEKLERIAKLRQCYQQQGDLKIYEHINSGASTPTSTLSKHSLPPSKVNLDELFSKCRRSDDMDSIYSEPAYQNLDMSKISPGLLPMNGLKLENFYSQMRKVPPLPSVLSDRPELLKPTQVVSPMINKNDPNFSALDVNFFKTFDFERSESLEFSSYQVFSEPASAALSPTKNEFFSLRHPDGASDTDLNKRLSIKQISEEILTITTCDDERPRVELRSPGNGASASDVEERLRSNSESKMTTSISRVGGSQGKKTKESTPSKLSKLGRFLGGRSSSCLAKSCSNKHPHQEMGSCRSNVGEIQPSSRFSPRLQLRNWARSSSSKFPSRSLPTSPPSEMTKKEIKLTGNKKCCIESTSEQSIQSLSASPTDKKHTKSAQSKLPTGSPINKSRSSSVNCKSTCEKHGHRKESKQNCAKHSNQSLNNKNFTKNQSVESNNDPEYDSGNDSGVVANHLLSSPYSRLTKPKIEHHSSSGHGSSDNSSTLSGDHTRTSILTSLNTPKVINRAPQPSGTSSGYESMVIDSQEGTGSSSNHDSASDSSGGGISRDAGKNLRKKPQGVCSCFRF